MNLLGSNVAVHCFSRKLPMLHIIYFMWISSRCSVKLRVILRVSIAVNSLGQKKKKSIISEKACNGICVPSSNRHVV